MKLLEVFEHLSYGEFAQLSVGNPEGEGEFGVTPETRHRLVSHINLGLTELHKRFLLREGRAQIYVVPGLRDYMVAADDILKIERVIAEGQELLINDLDNPDAVQTTGYRSLHLPIGVVSPVLDVVYRADHPVLSARDAAQDPARIEVDLPRTHLEALLYFVASRILNPMGASGGRSEFHEGNNYTAKFEQACRILENGGYRISQEAEHSKFQRGGWV